MKKKKESAYKRQALYSQWKALCRESTDCPYRTFSKTLAPHSRGHVMAVIFP